jgi:tetratricopeptide (TPR) repeat protein
MSGLLQIFCGPTQRDAVRVRIRHTLRHQVAEATADMPRIASRQDEEEIRWYLEEYLLYPFDPAPELAERVERRMEEIGAELFRRIFESGSDAFNIWLGVRGTLAETRLEIVGEHSGDPVFWELLRNPLDPVPVACAVQSFVRVSAAGGQDAAAREHRAMRVLMVIARPSGAADVRFRSVAARLLHRLDGQRTFEFEVLRPPTFDALERRLRSARSRGRPYTTLHFDGHGTYEDLTAKFGGSSGVKRGYVMFEDPEMPGMPDPVDGDRLGQLLLQHHVQIVLLNACRSARSEISPALSTEADIGPARSFGSFAAELIGAGIGAVVAMRYNIYVDTAAQFVAAVYEKLAAAEPLADAVTYARRGLLNNPRRASAGSTRELRDWMVPVLFHHHAVTIDALPSADSQPAIDTSRLPPPPSAGFIGRDNSLLELDRQFQSARLVLMWGQVGSGKTVTAAEFARWLAQTGGMQGPVLFTSFREPRPVHRVVDEVATAFAPQLRDRGIEWLTLDDTSRVRVLIDLLRATPCFWIWDNVEQVGKDGWSADEHARLGEFLAQAGATGTRVLLTSRERDLSWAAGAVTPLELPPMDLAERVELAVAIAGPDFAFAEEVWTPLFHFSQGNPFVLTLLVRQALVQRICSADAMDAFLNAIRATGSAELFGASVEYALRNQFTASEQAVLSLSSLFEGVVNETALQHVSQQRDPDKGPPSLAGSDRCAPLLQRAVALGVLTSMGSGYYGIHPGLPSHFGRIYDACYTAEQQSLLERSFAWLHGAIARVFSDQYQSGQPGAAEVAVGTLSLGEPNFKRALALARRHARWYDVVSLLRGFRVLMGHRGRWTEFARVVEEVGADFIDWGTDAPLPGQESFWMTIQGYRVDVLVHAHRVKEAERLQRQIVTRGREYLRSPEASGDATEESQAAFASCLNQLATIQKELGSKECIKTLEEALELAQRTGDVRLEHLVAYQMAGAYMEPEFRDWDASEYWLTYALDLTPTQDPIGRGAVLSGLGSHALTKMNDDGCSEADRRHWLAEAIRNFELALQVLPPEHVDARAVCNANLGLAYFSAGGDLTRAVNSFQQALALQEASDNHHQAGTTRFNLARVLKAAGDLKRCRLFAEAALRTFASLAPDAEREVAEAQDFIETLEEV